MLYEEIGHKYLRALKSMSAKRRLKKSTRGIPPVISELLTAASLPDVFCRFPTVFLGGRVYREERAESGQVIYSGVDPWREGLKKIVREVGYIGLDGMALDLHKRDAAAGAGRALLNIYLSPLYVIEGQGRIGTATVEEALQALGRGSNVGLVVRPEDYQAAVDYLHGIVEEYPPCLPPYFAALQLEAKDIICGDKSLPKWLEAETKRFNKSAFRGRELELQALGLVLYYADLYAPNRPEDLATYKEVLGRL